jgi:hypothetical protein
MPVEPIHQAPIETIKIFTVPRELFVAGFVPFAFMMPFAFMARNFLLMGFFGLGALAIQVALAWACSKDPWAFHRWAHSRTLPTKLEARSNLRGLKVPHR